MSYMGMIPAMVDYCAYMVERRIQNPANQGEPGKISILEIGVDTGQTALPLMHNLTCRGIGFDWVGVDIRQDHSFCQQLILMEGLEPSGLKGVKPKGREAHFFQMNSLDFLEATVGTNTYDLVLIDGDHNYDTVKKELSYLDRITHDLSLVICDDYGGRHENSDDFYERYESHKGLTHLSTHLDSDKNKGGATRAINEFVQGSDWSLSKTETEPVLMTRKLDFAFTMHDNITDPSGKFLVHPESMVHAFGIIDS